MHFTKYDKAEFLVATRWRISLESNAAEIGEFFNSNVRETFREPESLIEADLGIEAPGWETSLRDLKSAAANAYLSNIMDYQSWTRSLENKNFSEIRQLVETSEEASNFVHEHVPNSSSDQKRVEIRNLMRVPKADWAAHLSGSRRMKPVKKSAFKNAAKGDRWMIESSNEPEIRVSYSQGELLDAVAKDLITREAALGALTSNPNKTDEPEQGTTMSTAKTTLNMAKGAFVEGGKLTVAKKTNHLACQALTAGLKKAGVPEELLTTELAQKLASVLAPLTIHMAATHFSERIPKAELVQAGCEKALTVASMEAIEEMFAPILEAMLPAIGEMAMSMVSPSEKEAVDVTPDRTLGEREKTVVDDIFNGSFKEQPMTATH